MGFGEESGICIKMIEFLLGVIISRGIQKKNKDRACTKTWCI